MSSTTYFFLYKVSVEPREDADYSTLKQMLDNPPDPPVIMAKKGNQFQLDNSVRKVGELYTGTFCLIQRNELPTKARFGEEPTDVIGEDDDSGLGHYTSFLYDPSNEVIAIQSNRNGVSANGVVAYFRRNFKVKDIILEVIINPDEIEKLQQMTTISSFVVTIARPESGASFRKARQPKAIREMADIADKTNANSMTLQLSIGYDKKATLRKGSVVGYVRSLFSGNQSLEVKKIEIKGRETDDDHIEKLDLVTNKVSIPVAYTAPRTVTPRFLRDILKKVMEQYLELKPQIDSTYKVKRQHG